MFVHKAVESFQILKFVIAGCDLQQKDLNDRIKGKWLSDVHIHAAGVLFKRKYPGFSLQTDIHQCKANVVACENTIQIHHDDVNHQLVSANISGVVNVYDSIYQRHHNENIVFIIIVLSKFCC